jgi:hypothetical protein
LVHIEYDLAQQQLAANRSPQMALQVEHTSQSSIIHLKNQFQDEQDGEKQESLVSYT